MNPRYEPVRIYTPTFANVLNVSGVTYPRRGGLWFQRVLEEPGLVRVFGLAEVTFIGNGLSSFSLSIPPGVGAVGAGDVWGSMIYPAATEGVVLGVTVGAGSMVFLGTGVTGAQNCSVNLTLYTT